MFIIDLAWGAVQILVVGWGALFLLSDYRKGFPATRALAEKVQATAMHLLGKDQNDPVVFAERAIQSHAQLLGELKEAVASIKASQKQNVRLAGEQRQLAVEFRHIEEEALLKGDERTAVQAAVSKVNCEKRATLFAENAERQHQAVGVLMQEFDVAEAEFEILKTQGETIAVQHQIGQTNRKLYELTSDVQAKTGFTARGRLDQLLLKTEHSQLQSQELLNMTRARGAGLLKRIGYDVAVQAELEDARNKIALPAPASPPAFTMVEEAESVSHN